MGKLGSFAKQNKIAKALKEMGNIEKTIFILNYIMDEDFRRRVQRGLNKGEAINSLARALFFGKLGILREFSIKNQFQRAAALLCRTPSPSGMVLHKPAVPSSASRKCLPGKDPSHGRTPGDFRDRRRQADNVIV